MRPASWRAAGERRRRAADRDHCGPSARRGSDFKGGLVHRRAAEMRHHERLARPLRVPDHRAKVALGGRPVGAMIAAGGLGQPAPLPTAPEWRAPSPRRAGPRRAARPCPRRAGGRGRPVPDRPQGPAIAAPSFPARAGALLVAGGSLPDREERPADPGAVDRRVAGRRQHGGMVAAAAGVHGDQVMVPAGRIDGARDGALEAGNARVPTASGGQPPAELRQRVRIVRVQRQRPALQPLGLGVLAGVVFDRRQRWTGAHTQA